MTKTLIRRHDCASDPEVRMVKADALYYQGSFEHALVNYFKALAHNRSKVFIISNKFAWPYFRFLCPIRIEVSWWKR